MKLTYSPKLLREHINMLEIPSKEKILPKKALSTAGNEFKLYMPIYIKKFATAAVALAVVVSIISGVNNINFGGVTPTAPVDNRIVISGGTSEIHFEDNQDIIDSGNAPYPSWDFVVSDALKEKMQKYSRQDVWFRVLVKVDITDAPEYKISEEAQADLGEVKAQVDKLKKEINSITWNLYNTPENTITARMNAQRSLSEKIVKLNREITSIEQSDRIRFQNEQIENKLDIARNIGALNIINAQESSDCYFRTTVHIMEATSDMINALVESGYFKFALAPPARLDGYSNKISDSLTVKLASMSDSDTIEVAVVSTADNYNYFASHQGISANPNYNSKYNMALIKPKDYIGETIDLLNLTNKFIDNIVKRNGLTDKRIITDTLPTLEYSSDVGKNEFYATAGFNAALTKAEILSLVNDVDIKVIYLADTEKFFSEYNIYLDYELDFDQ